MNVVCYGPWSAAWLLWQPSPGAWAVTVACHAVFELAPGGSPMVARPPSLDPVDESDDRSVVEPWGPVAPRKERPEVIVVGHAYAETTATSLVARLGVGELDKRIQVHGESWFTQEGALVGPAPFTRMPLRWERAAGGPGAYNPVGVATGPAAAPDRQGRVPLPNLRPPAVAVARRDQVIPPAGLGPVRREWPQRRELLHRHADTWSAETWTERPLPEDFDIAYFNVAPPDQTLVELTGDERIVLENLHPRFARLSTRLEVSPPCGVAAFAGVERTVPLQCDTLVLDTDAGVAVLVWRGSFAVDDPAQEGVVFISPARLAPSSTGTLDGVRPGAAALPFEDAAGTTLSAPAAPRRPALPFHPAEDAAADGARPDEDPLDAEPPTVRRAAELARLLRQAQAERPPAVEDAEEAPSPSPPVAAPPVRQPPPPEPVIAERPPAPRVVEPPPPSSPPPPPPPPRPTVATSIDRCATVAAKLACRPDARAAILEAEDLTGDQWDAQHARWLARMDEEMDRGKKALLSAYDAAYVAALESERGPIAAGEYARLSVAAERGRITSALEEMSLPTDSMMRIRRVWLARMVKDPRAAAEVRSAMRVAAEG